MFQTERFNKTDLLTKIDVREQAYGDIKYDKYMNPTPYLQRTLAALAEPEDGAMDSSLQENELDED